MQPAVPWKNGGGITREIARVPADASLERFDWRVSRAQVATDGPFSRFDAVDRTLLVVSGAGLRLAIAGRGEVTLTRESEPLEFSGEVEVDAALVDGPVDDLNVMTRRGHARHAVSRRHALGDESVRVDGAALVLVIERGIAVVDNETLNEEDALVADAGESFVLHSATGADVILVELWSVT